MKIELINGSIIEIIESDDNIRSKRGNEQLKALKSNLMEGSENNMFIKFTIKKEDRIEVPTESYMGKPIISNERPIGVITSAIEDDNNIMIEAEIWDRFTNIENEYFTEGQYCSMLLNIN